ncbi:MAG: asparagine--tRNA ligase [Pseudobacteriovorax sp.]|nr:asparagine--tRNA ligase [Pseudobacteriovorax sp.]
MSRIRIKALLSGQKKDGESIRVCGWLRSKRVNKNLAFLVLNDGSSQNDIQCIVDAGTRAYESLGECTIGAALTIDGVLKASPGKGQSWEVHCDKVEISAGSAEDYPLQKKGHTMEFLREIAHLRGRSNTFGAVFRVRNELSYLIHQFFQSRGFMWVHTPILTASDAEGAGEAFQVTNFDMENPPLTEKNKVDWSKDFFGKQANLTVSGQLNAEAMALAFGDVYTFGPTFRAENSNTTRHLAEFWMVEPEIAFADLHDNSVLAEEFIGFLFREIVAKCPDELAFLSKHFKGLTPKEIDDLGRHPFGRISYTEAVAELEKAGKDFEFPVKWGIDLATEHERFLSEEVFKKPVIVTDYPKDIKAFYMRLNSDNRTVAAMDILVPRIGEMVGGAQREERYDVLEQRMKDMNIPAAELPWYLDLRKYGGCQHAGFGLGFGRLVQYVTGMTNIRDVYPFPRSANSISF